VTVEVEVEDHGPVRLVRLNRPEKANAINREMSLGIGRAFSTAAHDPAIRVLVLTGAGSRHFCAGMDLREFANRPAGPPAADAQDLGPGPAIFTENVYPKPIIAAVNGVAAGGGFGLVLACDIILAAENATFLIPEVRHGLVGVGVTNRAALRLPHHLTLRLALTAEPVSAAEARTASLVSEVLPGAELLARALELAQKIADYDPGAVQAAKQVVLATTQSRSGVDLAALRAQFTHVTNGAAARDGARAFAAGADSPRSDRS
jgi:enoyl-CoA hydratase/carnithine racemase